MTIDEMKARLATAESASANRMAAIESHLAHRVATIEEISRRVGNLEKGINDLQCQFPVQQHINASTVERMNRIEANVAHHIGVARPGDLESVVDKAIAALDAATAAQVESLAAYADAMAKKRPALKSGAEVAGNAHSTNDAWCATCPRCHKPYHPANHVCGPTSFDNAAPGVGVVSPPDLSTT